jgi:hypothetical protein
MMDAVLEKLHLTTAQVTSLYTPHPVEGERGAKVARDLCTRFGLDDNDPLGAQLFALVILTEEEGQWLDDE